MKITVAGLLFSALVAVCFADYVSYYDDSTDLGSAEHRLNKYYGNRYYPGHRHASYGHPHVASYLNLGSTNYGHKYAPVHYGYRSRRYAVEEPAADEHITAEEPAAEEHIAAEVPAVDEVVIEVEANNDSGKTDTTVIETLAQEEIAVAVVPLAEATPEETVLQDTMAVTVPVPTTVSSSSTAKSYKSAKKTVKY